jgi:hypothetical protein
VSKTDSQSKPVRWLYAVTASAAVIAGGLPQLTPDRLDWIGAAIGLGGLAIAAGVAKWTEGKVTPNENVAARVIETRAGVVKTIAGPAAEQRDGTSVEVVSTPVVTGGEVAPRPGGVYFDGAPPKYPDQPTGD